MRDGVNPKVQLAPPRARPNAVFLIEPFSLAVNLQTCAVDKKMKSLRTVKPHRQDCQATTATAEGRTIGDGDIAVSWRMNTKRMADIISACRR